MRLPTASYISLCVIAVVCAALLWRLNGMRSDFAGIDWKVPDFTAPVPPQGQIFAPPGQNASSTNVFTFPDGRVSFEYPADYQSGENLFKEESFGKLQANDVYFIVYKVTVPDLKVAYAIALESNASSTEAAVESIKQPFIQQQCAVESQTATTTNTAISAMIDYNYRCAGGMKGYESWRAQAALVKKESGFYVITAVSTQDNWQLFEPQARMIFDSITLNATLASQNETATSTDNARPGDNVPTVGQ